jgi:hypothetical protein
VSQPDRADYDAFVTRRTICDHLRGEFPDPPDPERSQEILDGTKEYCRGTDAQLKELKRRYAGDPAVMSVLKSFEENIEQ